MIFPAGEPAQTETYYSILGRFLVAPIRWNRGTNRRTQEDRIAQQPGKTQAEPPIWQSLVTGRAASGYQRPEKASGGRWLLRRNLGVEKYTLLPLGLADDVSKVDGDAVLTFEQARTKALDNHGLASAFSLLGHVRPRKQLVDPLCHPRPIPEQGHITLGIMPVSDQADL